MCIWNSLIKRTGRHPGTYVELERQNSDEVGPDSYRLEARIGVDSAGSERATRTVLAMLLYEDIIAKVNAIHQAISEGKPRAECATLCVELNQYMVNDDARPQLEEGCEP